MDIVMIAQFLGNIDDLESNNNRFLYLANILSENYSVEIITTDFYHKRKKHINGLTNFKKCKLTCLHESGYPKNVCLKRFASHKELSKNIKAYMKKRKVPDIIYCAVPSLDVAEVAAKYAKSVEVTFIIDIQDLWPEAFKMVCNVPFLNSLIYGPMEKKANFIYSSADYIVAVSETYAKRALKANSMARVSVVYLGTDKRMYDSYAHSDLSDIESDLSRTDLIKIVFAGSLEINCDLKTVIMALSKLKNKQNVRLLVMGDGSLREYFRNFADKKAVPAIFTGRIPYTQMVSYLSQCDIAVNPIKRGAATSMINIAIDYAMAGIPVVNTQESAEYRDLLAGYHAGINCTCEDSDSVAAALQTLISDSMLRKKMAENSRKLWTERLDKEETYTQLVGELLAKFGSAEEITRIAYAGTLGHSYNLRVIMKALRLIDEQMLRKIKFIVMGDGPKRAEFEKEGEGLPVLFTGQIPYQDMVWILSRCDIAVNPISKNAAQSIINKHADYAMAGLPVVNTQESEEYRDLISSYNCGINCDCDSPQQVAEAMQQLVENDSLRHEMGKNALDMAEKLFDRKNSYFAIKENIENLKGRFMG